MAACVEHSMQDLSLDKADASAQQQPETAKAVVPEQPSTPTSKEAAELEGTADKAKRRRRRGRKPAAAADKAVDENTAPADEDGTATGASAPVDVASILKARAAAKKGGRKQSSDAQKAALANAKARPAQKKKTSKGRQVADPGCGGY